MAAVRGVRSWLATGDWGQYRKHPWWAALLFGSTWMVNSLVFFAVLCSVMLAVLISASPPDSAPSGACCG